MLFLLIQGWNMTWICFWDSLFPNVIFWRTWVDYTDINFMSDTEKRDDHSRWFSSARLVWWSTLLVFLLQFVMLSRPVHQSITSIESLSCFLLEAQRRCSHTNIVSLTTTAIHHRNSKESAQICNRTTRDAFTPLHNLVSRFTASNHTKHI